MPGLTIGQLPVFTGTPNALQTIVYSGNNISYQYVYSPTNVLNRYGQAQTLQTATDTIVLFPNIDLPNSTGPTFITWDATNSYLYNSAPRAVVWTISCMISYQSNGTGTRASYIVKNGVSTEGTKRVAQMLSLPTNGDVSCHQLSCHLLMQPNDYIRTYAYQTSGSALQTGDGGGGISAGYSNRIGISVSYV
jgi:hypothetical protein